jgi:hypothetical protein
MSLASWRRRFFDRERRQLASRTLLQVEQLEERCLLATTVLAVGALSQLSQVNVFRDTSESALTASFVPFPASASVRVALGDVDGDGDTDLIAGLASGGSQVRVFDRQSAAEIRNFVAFTGFTGGVTVAAGDVNGDGRDDIIVGTATASSQVKVFDGASGAEIASFIAYPGFTGGVHVAAGDVSGDGRADILVGTATAASQVKVFDGASGAAIFSFLAFPGFSGGITVAAGDLNGDGRADIVAGTATQATQVKAFSGVSGAEIANFFAFSGLNSGVTVAAGDVTGDGSVDILAGLASGSGEVRAFNATAAVVADFLAFGPGFTGGVSVAALPLKGFAYDAANQALTITASAPQNVFGFSRVTTQDGSGQLRAAYTFTLNDNIVTYPASALASAVVNGARSGFNSASLLTNDTYAGIDGMVHETAERVTIGNGRGSVQPLDANGNAMGFLALSGFQAVFAVAGLADQGFIACTPGVSNVFVGAGNYAYMNTGANFYYLKGAQYVYSYALSPSDYAYQYDGSGASYFVVSGTAYSFMLGTDQGQRFFNEAVGFAFNEGIAQHPAQAIAYFYDSEGDDSFTGYSQYSVMTSTGASFAENNIAAYFGRVYAYSFVGATDDAYIYDPVVNTVIGFRRRV